MSLQSTDKTALRRKQNAIRQALSPEARLNKSAAIAARVLAFTPYQACDHVAAYYAVGSEVNCAPLFAQARLHHKTLYLPIVRPDPLYPLCFSPYTPGDLVHKNTWGIPEPIYDPNKAILPTALSLVLVPMQAFDVTGNRLGNGGGHYDRSFSWIAAARKARAAHCLLVGLAFDCQEVEQLPIDSWDLPVDCVITESRTLFCL